MKVSVFDLCFISGAGKVPSSS